MKLIFLIVFLGHVCSSFCQFEEHTFDRPGIADSPFTVYKKSHQIEGGLTFSNQNAVLEMFNPNIMYRTSFIKNNELRLTYNYVPQYLNLIKHLDSISSSTFAVGMKQKICDESGFRPELAILVNYFNKFELFKRNRLYNYHFLEINLLGLTNFTSHFNLNYNLGYTFSNSMVNNYLNYSLCLSYFPSETFDFFVEQFSYVNSKKHEIELGYDFGVIYHLKNFQIDVSYVVNQSRKIHYGNLLIGFSINFNSK